MEAKVRNGNVAEKPSMLLSEKGNSGQTQGAFRSQRALGGPTQMSLGVRPKKECVE